MSHRRITPAFLRPALALGACVVLLAGPARAQTPNYHLGPSFPVAGDGGWDYIALDTVGHRLFITRSDRVQVVDEQKGTLLGEVPGLNRGHGVAFAQDLNKGFATSGADSSVVIFDLRTLTATGRVTADPDADAILYDPATKRIFTFNGDSKTSSAIDPVTGQRLANIPLGGAPEFGVSAGDGTLFANIEDNGEIVQIDAAKLTVTRRWSIAPCQSPTGLAIDRAHHRLFSVCRNQMMVVSDAVAGKVVATAPIGMGVDAARFDPASRLAFASNGEGSITVVREVTPDSMAVAATVTTKRGARTMELDLKTHRLFTVTSDFGPAPAPTADRPRPRPPMLPGTFAVMTVEP